MGVRNALTLIGAVIGGIYGGPQGAQLGAAIGGFVGGVVDPEVIKTPSIGDVAAQKVGEGMPIPQYDGTAGGAGILVYASEPDIVVVQEQQGKGGPVVESERIYITFAIMVGMALRDGPGLRTGIPYLLRIWEDEKLVYDITPGSAILAESAEYATTFTWYPGTLDQGVDPDIEAIEGANNVPNYSGRALFVKNRYDATDRRGAPPVYRFEVATDSDSSLLTGRWWMTASGTEGLGKVWINSTIEDWSTATELDRDPYINPTDSGAGGGGYYRLSDTTAIMVNSDGEVERVDGLNLQNPVVPVISSPLANGPAYRVRTFAGFIFVFDRSAAATFYASSDGGATFEELDAPAFECADIGRINSRWIMFCQQASNRGWFYSDEPGLPTNWSPGAGPNAGNATDVIISMVGKAVKYTNAASIAVTFDGQNWTTVPGILPATGGGISLINFGCEGYDGGDTVIVGDVNGQYLFRTTDKCDTWEAIAFRGTRRIDWYDGRWVFNTTGNSVDLPGPYYSADNGDTIARAANMPTTPALANNVYAAPIVTQNTVPPGYTNLARVVKAAGRRCLIDDGRWNLPGLEDVPIRGVVVASQAYTAQDLINGLRYVKPSDASCHDGQIHIFLRGGAVDFELDEDFMVDEQSDAEQDETLRNGDDRQTAGLRLPAKINLMFPNANLGYQLTKATSPNYGEPTVREVTMEVPVVLDEETEAPALADILDKIIRTEADGELVRVFPDYLAAKAVAGTLIRLVDGELSRRTRVTNYRAWDGTRRLGLVMDRQRDFTSQHTAPAGEGWPTPPPSLVGETTLVVMNLPALSDLQEGLGVTVAIRGDVGSAWYGARLQYRVLGTTTWLDLGTYTQRTPMGLLLDPLPAGSSLYPDGVNPLSVRMDHDDDFETLSYEEWLSEMGAVAIVREDGTAEILQPRYAVNDTGQDWTLTEHQRGRLNTGATAHDAGDRLVVLDRSIFLTLPSSAMGKTLQFRAIALGSTGEGATIRQITWNPVLVQQEFPVSYLEGTRSGGTIDCTWIERRRFGTEINPIRSPTWEAFAITLTDGSTTETFDTLTPSFSRSDAAFSGPVTVTVQQRNRLTGLGPSTSLEIA